jgi:hypothetical protein
MLMTPFGHQPTPLPEVRGFFLLFSEPPAPPGKCDTMKVLVACEYSGTVRTAFARRGFEAWSCDLLPTEQPGNHYQGDIIDILTWKWDLIIAHPPCTFLTNSGVRWLYNSGGTKSPERWRQMRRATDFFRIFLNHPCKKICIENPIPHGHAMRLIGENYTQIVQPWMFGHGETKATCLWLKGLPKLRPTNIVTGREQRVWKMPPGPDRWKERSRTFDGIAEAMAEQFTSSFTVQAQLNF